MAVRALAVLALCALGVSAAAAQPAQTRDFGCSEWRHCRELALAAAARGDYETFHDLAWRAVQTGPAKDTALMYLLARAQSLSGRPRDALVMLDRLADMGVAPDATGEDFSRLRQLPGWPEVAARIERLREARVDADPSSPGAARTAAAPARTEPAATTAGPATTRTASAATRTEPEATRAEPGAPRAELAATRAESAAMPAPRLQPVEGVRFSTDAFSVSGLAYDAVSERFVFGDRLGRRLVVVSERSNRATDLVRAESAGFHDIAAMALDAKRGDVWVVSTTGTAARLHRLHLTSGRALRTYDLPSGAPINPVDVSIGADGAVLVLDAATPQLMVLRAGATALEPSVTLDAEEVSSLAAGGDARSAFVADRRGLLRIDLRSRRATRFALPASLAQARIERLGWHQGTLVAVTVVPDGARGVHRLALNAARTAISGATMLGSLGSGEQLFATFTEDELLYVLELSPDGGESTQATGSDRRGELVTYRVRLP